MSSRIVSTQEDHIVQPGRELTIELHVDRCSTLLCIKVWPETGAWMNVWSGFTVHCMNWKCMETEGSLSMQKQWYLSKNMEMEVASDTHFRDEGKLTDDAHSLLTSNQGLHCHYSLSHGSGHPSTMMDFHVSVSLLGRGILQVNVLRFCRYLCTCVCEFKSQ